MTKDFKCNVCDFKCSHNSNWKMHNKQVHDKIKDIQCKLCDYKCSQNGILKMHNKQVKKRQK